MSNTTSTSRSYRVSRESSSRINRTLSKLRRDNPEIRSKLNKIQELLEDSDDSDSEEEPEAKDCKIARLELEIIQKDRMIRKLRWENEDLKLKIGELENQVEDQAFDIATINQKLKTLEERVAEGQVSRDRFGDITLFAGATSGDKRVKDMVAVRPHMVKAHVRRGHFRSKPSSKRNSIEFNATATFSNSYDLY